ncbi:class-II fumarase/aspartase family protein [Turicimonas muris]|uniref:class-II fumarase/aspartase family protein n=1 Tax=Turicimonas muris TaxID=1796652 RepID=UPI00272CC2B3|nr:adenylosuccinate lyase family protein [Turicimonas muris]MBS4768497.1 adenylosuccinate lyase family protein [Burkholderiales bacterium]
MKLKLISSLMFSIALSSMAFAETPSLPTAQSSSSNTMSVFDSKIYEGLFGTKEMREIYNDQRLISYWLKFEAALANAQAKHGLIPEEAAQEISKACVLDNVDIQKLTEATRKVGRPVDGLVKQLRALNPTVKAYIHLGSTTQDVMDTATVLQMMDAIDVIEKQLTKLILRLADLSEKYKSTPMVSRTNGQDAIPTTFGMLTASYMAELNRNLSRMREAKERSRVGQLGSAVGTLSSLGPKALEIQKSALKNLGLKVPDMSWNASRDNYAEVVQVLALINGTLGRVATDINLWSRTADNSVNEGEGGASSTMPQKRNPRASEFLGGLAAMSRIRASGALEMLNQSETRQGAPWISEWSTIPEMFMTTSTALDRANRLFDKIIVKPEVMKARFNDAKQFVMAEAVQQSLASKVGLGQAHSLVVQAIKKTSKDTDFRTVLVNDPEIKKYMNEKEIEYALEPTNYLGQASELVNRAVRIARSNTLK